MNTDRSRIAFRFYRGTVVRRPASRLAKLARRVPNHPGRVPFYTDAFRTDSAGVANVDSALPYFNGTSTQGIITGEFMKEHKKMSRHLNNFLMKSILKSTE